MIKGILLDLDNTLLHNPDETFALEYLGLADAHFTQAWDYDGFSHAIQQVMAAFDGERDGRQTNRVLALETIADVTGRQPSQVASELRTFYTESYPVLQDCTQPVDGAVELIEYLAGQDYALVIATNPIYPAEAIYQRLRWAGLPDDPAYYAFITSADNMHFTKPHPAYYAEILARVGIEPDEAIVVGDSRKNDIQPARRIGMHTYHIVDVHQSDPSRASGTLRDFYDAVVLLGWLDKLLTIKHRPQMIEPQLQGNVGALFGLLDGIETRFWTQHPDPNEWSPLEIVCHLVESESSVQRPRLQRILAEENPFLTAPKPPPGPQEYVCEDSGADLAHQFAAARQQTIDLLRTLAPEDWYRPARHSIFGPTTLLEMAHFTAQHDRLHLNQLCQTLGKCE